MSRSSVQITVCTNGLHTHTHKGLSLGLPIRAPDAVAPPAATTRPGACSWEGGGGEQEGGVEPAMQQASRNPPKRGEEEGVPSYEAFIQGTPAGRKKGKTKDAPSYAPCIQGRAQEGGGVAAEVLLMVVARCRHF